MDQTNGGNLEHDDDSNSQRRDSLPIGAIETLLSRYTPKSRRLMGYPLNMSYENCRILTCDSWKVKCAGIPKGCFFIMKLSAKTVKAHPELGNHLLIGRILDSAPLPIQEDRDLVVLELHKQAVSPDSLTNMELQWSGIKGEILGTFTDTYSDSNKPEIQFGGDVPLFLSPHLYECYCPTNQDLEFLVNHFVIDKLHTSIGKLRYTESNAIVFTDPLNVRVDVSPIDFIGQRAGIFGMTRLGKSNLTKILAETIIKSGRTVGQIIFDPSGEYTYLNSQDQTSLYCLHRDHCVRYSFKPRLSPEEKNLGLPMPKSLHLNFYDQASLGHAFLKNILSENGKLPDYITSVLSWEVIDPADINEIITDKGEQTRYRRSLSMYFSVLRKAGFAPPTGKQVLHMHLHRELRAALAQRRPLVGNSVRVTTVNERVELCDEQHIDQAGNIYKELYLLFQEEKDNPTLFPASDSSGKAYFDPIDHQLLKMHGQSGLSGPAKFEPMSKYHNPSGSDIRASIIGEIDRGKTVILDLSGANGELAEKYSDFISDAILKHQMQKFTDNGMGEHFVMFYFEEAHRLFPANDKQLRNNIYNILGKEGGKYHIGMVFATQSISSISPDLLANSENIFVTHLSDFREVKDLANRHEFSEVAETIHRTQAVGFVHMATKSHRFAIPVQIYKFQSQPIR